jgi:hypothetical protein
LAADDRFGSITISAQVRARTGFPDERSPQGYSKIFMGVIDDGTLLVFDEQGVFVGAHDMKPGDNPEVLTKQMGLRSWRKRYPETQWTRRFSMPQRSEFPLGVGDAPV